MKYRIVWKANSTKTGYYIAQYKSFLFWKTVGEYVLWYNDVGWEDTRFESIDEAVCAVKDEIDSILNSSRSNEIVLHGEHP